MPYCIVNWVPDPEGGRRPDLPEGLGFCLLAGPHHADFALFDVSELPSTADTVDSNRLRERLASWLYVERLRSASRK